MPRFAIRLLTLGLFVAALGTVPMTAPAKAATDASTAVKKKHKKIKPTGAQVQTPATQYPRNMSEDPDRKTSY